ncbi:hypothetical protein F2P81_026322 [Scophthalmus maximus]|uniref:Uncharacterized protein n=1 Tax=Scophthalmus maximus TaxID=52904 RepID=A0A6A4RM69_SCOMX|nr:hypothetical protein F2P81_026322 [Scophthalmus maximus]
MFNRSEPKNTTCVHRCLESGVWEANQPPRRRNCCTTRRGGDGRQKRSHRLTVSRRVGDCNADDCVLFEHLPRCLVGLRHLLPGQLLQESSALDVV